MTYNPRLKGVYETLRGQTGHAELHIQDAIPLGRGLHKVVAAVSGMTRESELEAAIASVTDGAARLVPGSTFRKGRILSAVIAANNRSQPYDDKAYKMVSSETAADSSGAIWRVVNDGSGRRVVMENADDLDAILAERIAHKRVVANPLEGRGVATASVQNGDLVRYVVTDGAPRVECALAFVVDGQLRGVSAGSKDSVPITANAVLESISGRQLGAAVAALQKEVAGTSLSPAQLEQAIAYLTKAGVLSDVMAEKMRSLSSTPNAERVAA